MVLQKFNLSLKKNKKKNEGASGHHPSFFYKFDFNLVLKAVHAAIVCLVLGLRTW